MSASIHAETKSMYRLPISRTTGFLAIALGLSLTSGAVLSACSTATQTSSTSTASSPSASDAGMKQMDHGSMGTMNHTMDLGPADADYDLRFIDGMIPHHEGAVVMAKEVLQKSQRPELKKLAKDIIAAQAKEIAEMKQWRAAWYPKAPSTPMTWHSQMGHMMAMSADQKKSMMMSMDLGAADKQFDLRFLDAMIPHHEGALTMAQDALKKSKRPDIQKLAKAIITSQKAEIKQMQTWKQAWYKQ